MKMHKNPKADCVFQSCELWGWDTWESSSCCSGSRNKQGHRLKSTCFHWLDKMQAGVTSPVFKLYFHPLPYGSPACSIISLTVLNATLHAHLFWRMGGHFQLTCKVFVICLSVMLPYELTNCLLTRYLSLIQRTEDVLSFSHNATLCPPLCFPV